MNALNRLLACFQQSRTEYVKSLQAGLSRDEIERRIQDLPIKFPEEVYELYQWRNGSTSELDFLPGYLFPPLEEMVEQYYSYQEIFDEQWSPTWFPIFSLEGNSYIIKTEQATSQQASIWAFDYEEDEPVQHYDSLRALLLTLAEGCEMGAYVFENGNYLERDKQQIARIHRKYNPNLSQSLLEKLQSEPTLNSLSQIAEGLMMTKDPRAVEPLIQILNSPQPETRTWHEHAGMQGLVARILGSIGDPKAVTSLIQISQAEEWMTRYWVAIALGELKDPRAVPGLVNLLNDERAEVRQTAIWALGEIGDLAAVRPLAQLAEADGVEDSVRSAAREALAKIESRNLQS